MVINYVLVEDGQLNSVISLGRCLSLLRASLGEDVIYCLEQDLYHTQDLEQVAIRIVANLMQTGCVLTLSVCITLSLYVRI